MNEPSTPFIRGVSPALEILRRAGLFLAIAAAAVCAMWFQSTPLIRIDPYEKPESVYQTPAPDALLPETEQESYVLPDKETIEVSGPEWKSFLDKVIQCFESDRPVKGWEKRLDGYYREGWSLISLSFKPDEPPISSIASRMQPGNSYYIKHKESQQTVEAYYCVPEMPDFNESTANYPAAFVFPLRRYALPLLAGGLLLYMLLPWPARRPGLIRIKRWQIILMDLASVIMFGMFFALPFFVTGSSQELIIHYWLFALFFWLLAALAVLMAYWSTWYSCYQVGIENGSLIISSISGSTQWRLADIAEYRTVTLKPPRWLIRLLWIGALLGKRPGTAGQALILSSSEQQGLLLKNRDGQKTYIWTTNAMGQEAAENLQDLVKALEQARVPFNQEPLEIRSFFPPTK